MMPLSAHAWTVLCRGCDLVVGIVEDGRFEHDPTCSQPLAIGAGTMRCCQCGGSLTAGQRPAARPRPADELVPTPIVRFGAREAAKGELRQRR